MKNLKITEETHRKLKTFCSTQGMKINWFVEKTILSAIGEDNDLSNIQNHQHEDKQNLRGINK